MSKRPDVFLRKIAKIWSEISYRISKYHKNTIQTQLMLEFKKESLIFCGISTAFLLSSTSGVSANKIVKKPNVLFIIMDDMNNWTGYLGVNKQVKTPNLDKLATRAINFCNGYAAAPLSNPSRSALMSGIPPYTSGVYSNGESIAEHPVVNNSVFMPQHFKNNGYETIAAGKIFHTKPSKEIMTAMWDDMSNIDGGYGPWIQHTTLPPYLQDRARDFQEWTGPDTDFPDVINSQKIIQFIEQSHEKPFFAAMGFYRPHNPWTAPKRFFDLYDINAIQRPYTTPDDLNDIPQYAIDNFIGQKNRDVIKYMAENGNENGNYWNQFIRAYLACVSFADERVGMIINALDRSPYAENTWIVLIGDNGFHHGEKERRAKAALWRKANNVPFLIVPPKNYKAAKPAICKHPVSLLDLYPTLVDACNLKPVENNQLAGKSLVPLLNNPKMGWNKPAISTYLEGNFTVHQNAWNYIRYADGSQELYNIDEDEPEIKNKANDPKYKGVINSLSKFVPKTWYVNANPKTKKEPF